MPASQYLSCYPAGLPTRSEMAHGMTPLFTDKRLAKEAMLYHLEALVGTGPQSPVYYSVQHGAEWEPHYNIPPEGPHSVLYMTILLFKGC